MSRVCHHLAQHVPLTCPFCRAVNEPLAWRGAHGRPGVGKTCPPCLSLPQSPEAPLQALTTARVLTGFPVFGVSEEHTYGPQEVAASGQQGPSSLEAGWGRCSRKPWSTMGELKLGLEARGVSQPGRKPVLEELHKPHISDPAVWPCSGCGLGQSWQDPELGRHRTLWWRQQP